MKPIWEIPNRTGKTARLRLPIALKPGFRLAVPAACTRPRPAAVERLPVQHQLVRHRPAPPPVVRHPRVARLVATVAVVPAAATEVAMEIATAVAVRDSVP